MTPAQRLYCEALRNARGKSIPLAEARSLAHWAVSSYISDPPSFISDHPRIPWADIEQPFLPRFPPIQEPSE